MDLNRGVFALPLQFYKMLINFFPIMYIVDLFVYFFILQFWDISDENYSLASLDLVMRVIPLCGSLIGPGTTQQITNLVVQVIGSEEAKEGYIHFIYLLTEREREILMNQDEIYSTGTSASLL